MAAFQPATASRNVIASIIFFSRWLQAPLYFGLIVAQGVYVYHFMLELWHLIEKATTSLKRITVSLDALDDTVFRRMNDVDFPVADVLAGAPVGGVPIHRRSS